MAAHSSVLAWRIPGTGKPGGLPSMGSHRVRYDWSDLAAAAAVAVWIWWCAVKVELQVKPWPHSRLRSLRSMNSLMSSQLWARAKGFVRSFTFITFLCSMNSRMMSKCWVLLKAFPHSVHLYGLPSMNSLMFSKSRTVHKGLATIYTFIMCLPHMNSVIFTKIWTGNKGFAHSVHL